MANTKTSSPKLASTASRTLSSNSASPLQKSLAASVLAQSHTAKQTGKAMETKASQALQIKATSPATKTLAASVVAQSNKKR